MIYTYTIGTYKCAHKMALSFLGQLNRKPQYIAKATYLNKKIS